MCGKGRNGPLLRRLMQKKEYKDLPISNLRALAVKYAMISMGERRATWPTHPRRGPSVFTRENDTP